MKILNMLGTAIVFVGSAFIFACAFVGVQPWSVF